jgi:anti-anti-sigma regulatory factor
MASNFKLFLHETGDGIHMKMCGDFDGTSACELITEIQKHARKSNQVFIHTEDLDNIYSFGRGVFHNNLGVLKKQSDKIVFVGKHKDSLIL